MAVDAVRRSVSSTRTTGWGCRCGELDDVLDMPMAALPSRATTGEQVADLLQDAIMSGHLRRGTPLREEEVATRFGVSRRSARDALRVLESHGLVRHQRHKGSAVTDFTAADVRDIYRTRRVLELAAAQRCADEPEVRGDARFAALTNALRRLADASGRGDMRGIVDADVGFHAAVVGLLGSARTDRFFGALAVEMRYAIAIIESEHQETVYRPREALAEHQAIYDALAAGPVDEAKRLIWEHVDSNCERLVAIVSAT